MFKPRNSFVKPAALRLMYWLVATAFLAYFAVLIYSERWPPGDTGLELEFVSDTVRVSRVRVATPADRAGLRAGDLVLAVDGNGLRTWEDWRLFRATRETGRTYQFRILRATNALEVPLLLKRAPAAPAQALERKRYVQAGLLVMALVMGSFRSSGAERWVATWLLASIGTAPLFPEAEMTAVWRGLPGLLGAMLWIPQVSHTLLLPLLFTFFASLPRPSFQARRFWICIWAPALLIALSCAPRLYQQIYQPPLIQELPAWLRFVLGLGILVYGGGGLVVLLRNYNRAEFHTRQRFRVFVIGALVGVGPLIPFLAAIFWGTLTQSEWVWFFVSDRYRHTMIGFFLVFVVSLGFSIFRYRLFREVNPAHRSVPFETRGSPKE